MKLDQACVRMYREKMSKLSLLILQTLHRLGSEKGRQLLNNVDSLVREEVKTWQQEGESLAPDQRIALKRLFDGVTFTRRGKGGP